MTTHLALQRPMLPTAQVSALTSGSITLPSARGAFVDPTNFESIATYTVSGSSTSVITFSSISQTYTHLVLRGLLKLSPTSGTDITCYVKFNSDAGSNYTWAVINGYNATASVGNRSVSTSTGIGFTAAPSSATALASMYGPMIVTIEDYSNSNKFTTLRSFDGDVANSTYGNLDYRGGVWANTAAVTQMDLYAGSGNYVAGSTIALYGIKGY